jgi:xylulokinase
MPSEILAGIDLGTSGVRAVLVHPERGVLTSAAREYGIEMPNPGWAEQDPHTWYQAAVEALGRAVTKAGISPQEVAAIGVCGQMHGTVCLDKQGNALRPAIIWADRRSQKQVAEIKEKVGEGRLGDWTGNPLVTGFMLATYQWLRENEPETLQNSQWLCLPKDYLRYRLTDHIGTEPSDGSSTSLFDPVSRDWSQSLLDALEIDPGLLPPVHPSAAVAGYLVPEAARASGLSPGIPVVFGGSDQACQALGNGVIDPGVISCTIGTGGQVLAPLASPQHDPELRVHLFCHCLPDRWHLLAATLAAGLSLKWLRDSVLAGSSFQALVDLATEVPPGAEGLYFTPYLVGERTPYMDSDARGSWVGLTLRHHRGHLVRAVMEGVVFSLRQGLELILKMGVPVERIIASGGGTQHPLWLQLQADVFQRPVYQARTVQPAALGAALLAGVGIGTFASAAEACERVVRLRREIVMPNQDNVALYQESYERYVQLYPRLKGFFS